MIRPGTNGSDPRREPLDPVEREMAERLARLGPHGAPPTAIDARILAAAHAATNATPRRARRLPVAVGVAASLVLALGLAWQLRPLLDPPPVESDSMDMGAAGTDGSKATAPAPGPAQERAAAEEDAAQAPPAARVAGPDRVPAVAAAPAALPPPSAPATVKPEAFPAPAPPPAPPPPPPASPPAVPAPRPSAAAAPAPPAETEEAAGIRSRTAESQRRLDQGREAAPQATMPESAAADDSADAPQSEADLRQRQLERIRDLRDAGQVGQARDELEDFLDRWPGYPLPDDLQRLRR